MKEGGCCIHIGIGEGVTFAINNDRWQHRDPFSLREFIRERERERPFVKGRAELATVVREWAGMRRKVRERLLLQLPPPQPFRRPSVCNANASEASPLLLSRCSHFSLFPPFIVPPQSCGIFIFYHACSLAFKFSRWRHCQKSKKALPADKKH